MPHLVKPLLGTVCVTVVLAGILYAARPQIVQRIVLARMRRSGEVGVDFVKRTIFLWFVRVVGVIFILVGLRGIYAIRLWHG